MQKKIPVVENSKYNSLNARPFKSYENWSSVDKVINEKGNSVEQAVACSE